MTNFKISFVENPCLPFRSSRSQMFFKVGTLKSYALFTEKHLHRSLFIIKFQACNFIKKKLQLRCFLVNIAQFLRTAFFIEHLRWLLLPFTTTFRNYYWKDRLVILFTLTHPSDLMHVLKLILEKVDIKACEIRLKLTIKTSEKKSWK